jgi:hypothetical protein
MNGSEVARTGNCGHDLEFFFPPVANTGSRAEMMASASADRRHRR